MFKVLVVDDDQGLRLSIGATLTAIGKYEVHEAADGLEAVTKVRAGKFDLVLLDVDMPNLNGIDALKFIKDHDPGIIVIVLTAYSNIEDAVKVVKEGAYNYVSKPIKSDEITEMLDKALEAHDLIKKVAASAPILTVEGGRKFVGTSREMQKVFNIVNKLSKVTTPVLVRGESGTGKELVARAIHYNSARKNEKFVAINCSAIPETLFESELFGHEKGSFTGADQRKIGRFQFAEGGTLFLDEVGDLSPTMQVKLLRVLQEKKFTPVGSNREIETDVRIIAATNRNLDEMIKTNQFREDLFYRLNVIPVNLPPLRDRKDDIDHLLTIFVTKFNKSHQKEVTGLSPDAIACLKKYQWPGNIRELENVIEHAFIIEGGNKITLASLPENITGISDDDHFTENPSDQSDSGAATGALAGSGPAAGAIAGSGAGAGSGADAAAGIGARGGVGASSAVGNHVMDFNRQKELFEKEFIIKALKTFKGRINQTALHANIPKKTLLRKIEKYGIVAREYSEPKN